MFYLFLENLRPPTLSRCCKDPDWPSGKAVVDYYFIQDDGGMFKAGRQEPAGKETWTEALTYISENSGYKTILNCSDANIPFYQKCGYVKKEN
ncbi:hypothetical protein ARMSODRAFT_955267 [Armillaria solidipes]|uniref:Uncharacterized protein n=1 Tax=Armillaria solidipes TaxID=1076256 RepID=A0A2H3BKR5_9AGAR|nr:hypothetical protein ARMSODRAFT_955267 [Armillaria solidipes]